MGAKFPPMPAHPTHNNNTLDHCYAVHMNAYNVLVRAPLGESDHSTVLLIPTYRQQLKMIKPTQKVVRKLTDDSYNVPRGCFECTDWNMFKESCGGIDEFTDTLTSYISCCAVVAAQVVAVSTGRWPSTVTADTAVAGSCTCTLARLLGFRDFFLLCFALNNLLGRTEM